MKRLTLSLLLATSLPALADRLPLPAVAPSSYRSECGSCHLPYPPALLAANDWQSIINRLDQHFGSDASLETTEQARIARFLIRHEKDAQIIGTVRF